MIKLIIELVVFGIGLFSFIIGLKRGDIKLIGSGLFLLWATTFFEVMEIRRILRNKK